MRSFKAARRSAERRPVPFLYRYDVEKEITDPETGEVIGTEFVEEKVLFECRGEVSSLLLSELAYNADMSVADPAAMKLIRQFFANAFDDNEQYRRFFDLHMRYGTDDLLMEILGGLVEDFSDRPTVSPSPSQSGPENTGDPLKVVSLSRGTVEVVEGSVEAEVSEVSPQASSV